MSTSISGVDVGSALKMQKEMVMKLTIAILATLTLVACGGSGGGDNSSSAPADVANPGQPAEKVLGGFYAGTANFVPGSSNRRCWTIPSPSDNGYTLPAFFIDGSTIKAMTGTYSLSAAVAGGAAIAGTAMDIESVSDDKTSFVVNYSITGCQRTYVLVPNATNPF